MESTPEINVYVDDLVGGVDTFQELCDLITRVLTLLRQKRLRLKASKCIVGAKEMMVLGHQVTTSGVQVDGERVAAIDKIPFPKTQKALATFQGIRYTRPHLGSSIHQRYESDILGTSGGHSGSAYSTCRILNYAI
jgi:hypothetical protein